MSGMDQLGRMDTVLSLDPLGIISMEAVHREGAGINPSPQPAVLGGHSQPQFGYFQPETVAS